MFVQPFEQKVKEANEHARALAVYLGPAEYLNPRVTLGQSDLKVKCIFVWAWIQSRPDSVQADEASVRSILERVDYDGLSKLIQ